MKKIIAKSRQGVLTEIFVDDEDFDYLSQFTWRILKTNRMKYAARCVTVSDQKLLGYPTSVKMHREVMGLAGDKHQLVDHKDHDGLNNQKINLRVCSGTNNQGNRRKINQCTSVYKGVCWGYKKWRAYIKLGAGKRKELGSYIIEEDAALAYNEAAIKYFGEYANLNVIKKHNIQHEN